MAATGYHPPQFSEETAWLPPWLQPQQMPFPDDHTKYVQTNSQLECKNLAYCQENIGDKLDDQFFTRGDARYNSCHLFLSGEDNSSAGNTSCSPTGLHFQLYLSSEGITQISSSQLHDVLQKRTCESNKGSSREPVPDISVHELDGQYKMDDGASTANFPPKGCISPLSKRDPSEVPAKCNQYRRKKIQKFDTGNLENADIDGAVELSIAASEAMVISELANSGLHSELLSAAAVLEVALRLKEARKRHSDVSEIVAAYPTDELDETDHLCYLDEKTMADAFVDIGISVTQVVRTPDNSSGDKTLQHKDHTTTCSSDAKQCCTSQSNSPNVLSKPISESNCGCATFKQSDGLKAQDFDIYVSRTKSNSDFSMECRSNDLTEEALPVEQMGPSACAPLDSDTPSIKRQLKAHPQNLVPNYIDSLAANQVILKGIRRVLKDGNNATHKDHNIPKGIPKLFIGETSFISESVDVTGENISVQGLEAGPEIVASARRSSEDLSAFKCRENKRTHEEVALSQDVVGSSNFSLIDPLCSVVPCSISSDIAGISICGNQNSIEEGEGCLSPTDALVSLQNLHGNNTLSNTKETSISIMLAQVQGGACNASGESSRVSRKKLSSLKTYSMVTPVQNTYSEGKSLLQNEPSQLIGMTENIRHLLPDERSDRFMASENEEAAGIALKLNINYDPSSSGKIETKDHVLSDGPSGSGEPVLDLTGQNVHHDVTVDNICRFKIDQYEKRCSPIVLNCGTRWHLRACNKIRSTDNEDEDLKIRRVPKRKIRNRMVNSLNGDSSKDQTDVNSQSPLHSAFQSHPRKKECLPYKRVRFSDAEVKLHVNKTDQRLQSGNETRLCTRTSRRVKRSCLRSKSNIGEDNNNCLIPVKDVKGMLFQGLDFLLTGFSRQKEKEIETLIRRHGGVAHPRILSPSPFVREKREKRCANQNLPIILSPKKVQTTKFLYGCAVNTWMLNANWLSDSIQAGSIMPPGKYLTVQNKHLERKHLLIGQTEYCSGKFIFDKLGVMLYGKTSFCTKFSNIIKHGGGQVFKSLQWLIQSLKNGKNSVGAVLVEDENRVSRHLKHCALEHNLPTLPASWIINSLFSGKLLPFKKDRSAPLHRIKMPIFHLPKDIDMSEEI